MGCKLKSDFAAKAAWVLYALIFAASLLLFAHPDLVETANHARVLLDCVFEGRFFDFYRVVAEHANSFYYINEAHYNIAFYLIFALWELPFYLLGKLIPLLAREQLMWVWAKALPALCSVLNAFLLGGLVARVSGREDGALARDALLLSPIAFFFPLVMGQYDDICVTFILLALFFYIKGDMPRFSLLMSAAALCKSFALLLVLPLILLAEKKLLPILRDLALCIAPSVVTALLFPSSADGANFTSVMLGKLFTLRLWDRVPIFPALLAVTCVWCWLRKAPQQERERLAAAAQLGLLVFAGLILIIEWHPQWIYLFVPFWVLCVYLGENRTLYHYLCALTSVGVILACWCSVPNHLESNLLYLGAFGIQLMTEPIAHFISLVPALGYVASALLYAALAAVLAARLPFSGGRSLADRAAAEGVTPPSARPRLWLWADFLLGLGFWACGMLAPLFYNGLL